MDVAMNSILTRYTERAAMKAFCAVNISLCLKKHQKVASFNIVDVKKAEAHTIFAKSVNDLRLWKRGLQAKKVDVDSGCFTTVKERVEAMQDFLLGYKKYRNIATSDDTEKLHDMLIFSAIIRTAEQRYAEGRIIDPEVRQRVATYLWERENNEGMSRAANHARKHDEDVREAIDAVYRASLDKAADIITPIWTEPLPPLPVGTLHALAWCGLLGAGV